MTIKFIFQISSKGNSTIPFIYSKLFALIITYWTLKIEHSCLLDYFKEPGLLLINFSKDPNVQLEFETPKAAYGFHFCVELSAQYYNFTKNELLRRYFSRIFSRYFGNNLHSENYSYWNYDSVSVSLDTIVNNMPLNKLMMLGKHKVLQTIKRKYLFMYKKIGCFLTDSIFFTMTSTRKGGGGVEIFHVLEILLFLNNIIILIIFGDDSYFFCGCHKFMIPSLKCAYLKNWKVLYCDIFDILFPCKGKDIHIFFLH